MKRMMAVMLSMALAGSVVAAQAQQEAAPAKAKSSPKKTVAKKDGPTVSDQLGEMKQAIDAQQQAIKQLTDLVQSRDQKIQQLEQRLDQSQALATQAQTNANTAVAQTAAEQQAVMALKSDVTDLKTTATSSAMTLQETQKSVKDALENPVAIRYKGITITPGGFLAGESVYRNHATGGDATAFNSIFMPGSGANAVSEFYGSGRQSQINMLAEGKLANVKLSGYYEADFLGAAPTSNNNQTNSYVLRQRQAWAAAALDNGWTFTGGQMWTLLTENRKGIDNLSTARPMTIDPNYNVGFSFARQWGFRAIKNFNNHFWLAASLEDPQTTFSASNANTNFALGSGGVSAGLYDPAITACTTTTVNNPTPGGNPISTTTCTNASNYAFNAMPDIILKAALEPGFGHYEVFGVFSRFRDRVYPCAVGTQAPTLCDTGAGGAIVNSTVGAYNYTANGGGVGGNARFSMMNKHVDFGIHALYGNGLGRYAASGLPDATVDPLGRLVPLRTYQGLLTLELHYPKLDVYLYGGEDYVGHHYEVDSLGTGKTVGYGSTGVVPGTTAYSDGGCYTETLPSASSPSGYNFGAVGSCSGQTQSVIEGTFGFWIKPYNGPKGRFQFGPQYSYVSRNAYAGINTATTPVTSVSPHGIDNIFYTSFRYYLP
ncbi:MAG: hypothetical protein WBZ01_11070 [Terriglobales bacterium]|jgi:hypothetical protein